MTVEEYRKISKKKPRKKPAGLIFIEAELIRAGITYETEFRFAKPRLFRADIHLIGKNILIEYEGLMAEKSRHTSLKGYTVDCEKYNLAVYLGFKVFRYTVLNYKNIRDLIDWVNGNG